MPCDLHLFPCFTISFIFFYYSQEITLWSTTASWSGLKIMQEPLPCILWHCRLLFMAGLEGRGTLMMCDVGKLLSLFMGHSMCRDRFRFNVPEQNCVLCLSEEGVVWAAWCCAASALWLLDVVDTAETLHSNSRWLWNQSSPKLTSPFEPYWWNAVILPRVSLGEVPVCMRRVSRGDRSFWSGGLTLSAVPVSVSARRSAGWEPAPGAQEPWKAQQCWTLCPGWLCQGSPVVSGSPNVPTLCQTRVRS